MNRFSILILFLMFSLSGCETHLREENAKLQAQVQALSKNIQDRAADIAYFENQAGIASGCDFLIPVCPASVVNAGHQAIQAGYGGGTKLWFWFAFVMKLTALGFIIGTTYGTSVWMWHWAGKPEKRKADEARSAIAQSEKKVEIAMQAVRKAQEEERILQAGAREKADQIRAASIQLATIQQEIEKAEEDLETVEQAAEALKAFSN